MDIKTTAQIEKNIFAEKGAEEGNRQGIIKTCVALTAQAKLLVPVDKGQLRNSLMWKVENKEGGFNEGGGQGVSGEDRLSISAPSKKDNIKGIAGTNSDHWHPEFGTRYQRAQPFLRPAKEIVIDGAGGAQIMKKYSKEEMEKAFQARKKEIEKL